MPFTSPHGVRPVNGLPVAEVSTSGYTAQPCVGSKRERAGVRRIGEHEPPGRDAQGLARGGQRDREGVAGAVFTCQSASGLAPAAGATAPEQRWPP